MNSIGNGLGRGDIFGNRMAADAKNPMMLQNAKSTMMKNGPYANSMTQPIYFPRSQSRVNHPMGTTQMMSSADAKAPLDNANLGQPQRKPLANNLLNQQPWPPSAIGKPDFAALQNLQATRTG